MQYVLTITVLILYHSDIFFGLLNKQYRIYLMCVFFFSDIPNGQYHIVHDIAHCCTVRGVSLKQLSFAGAVDDGCLVLELAKRTGDGKGRGSGLCVACCLLDEACVHRRGVWNLGGEGRVSA